MKRTLIAALLLTGLILAPAAAAPAASAGGMRVDVPFAFYAGGSKLPAGEYLIEMRSLAGRTTASTIVIRQRDGLGSRILFALPGDHDGAGSPDGLVFHRYADSYFLSEVRHTGLQSSLAASSLEKEMAVAQVNRPVSIAAVR